MYTECRYTTKRVRKERGAQINIIKLGFTFFLNAGNPGPEKSCPKKVSGLKKVSPPTNPVCNQHTKKHPNGEPVKNASIQKTKGKRTWSHKRNSLVLTKVSLFQLRKDGDVRPVGDLTIVALVKLPPSQRRQSELA